MKTLVNKAEKVRMLHETLQRPFKCEQGLAWGLSIPELSFERKHEPAASESCIFRNRDRAPQELECQLHVAF